MRVFPCVGRFGGQEDVMRILLGFDDSPHAGLDLLFAADIHRQRRTIRRCRRGGLGCLEIKIGINHARAICREKICDSFPDSPRCAGHQCDLACEVNFHFASD